MRGQILADGHVDRLLAEATPLSIQVNLSKGGNAAVRAELKRQLGLVGRSAHEETDVLILKAKSTGLPFISPPNPAKFLLHRGKMSLKNQTARALAARLEGLFSMPVLDQTDSAGPLTTELQWNQGDTETEIQSLRKALSDGLGLELISGRETMDVLVVEKTGK